MNKRTLSVLTALLTFSSLPALAQQKTLKIRGALSISTQNTDFFYLRTYGFISANVGTKWKLQLGGASPKTKFALCGSYDDKVMDCWYDFDTTDQNGNWSWEGAFDEYSKGSYTEWMLFPDGSTSNRIVFTVGNITTAGNLRVNSSPIGVYHVGQSWTRTFSGAGRYNEKFDLCKEVEGRTVTCTANAGTTDGNGYWTSKGTYGNDDVGGSTYWIKFKDGKMSNRVAFTVDTEPVDENTCEKGTVYPIGPNAGYLDFRRFQDDWNPKQNEQTPFTVVPNRTGGYGNTLEYYGCWGGNYIWLQWAYDSFAAMIFGAPWEGHTDRGLRIGDSLAKFKELYPAAHHPPKNPPTGMPKDVDVWDNGPLRVAFKDGAVVLIMVDWWASFGGNAAPDQKDPY